MNVLLEFCLQKLPNIVNWVLVDFVHGSIPENPGISKSLIDANAALIIVI
jgi:hypothetical protein